MDQILANNTNAETGTCPAAPAVPAVVPIPIVECYAEFLPTADYVGDVLAGNNAPSRRLTSGSPLGTSTPRPAATRSTT